MRVFCNSLLPVPWQQAPEFNSSRLSLFLTDVSPHQASSANLKLLLQPSELIRGGRYYNPDDELRFLVGRATLRLVLSKYLNQAPAEIILSGGGTQKPWLPAAPNLHFNLSHSGNRVLIGVFSQTLGVDIEEVKPAFDYQDIVQHSFSRAEQDRLRKGGIDSRHLFYQSWTRKEALVKATAQGIGSNLRSIPCLDGLNEVSAEASAQPLGWTVSSIYVSADYLAAVAYRPGRNTTPLSFFRFFPDFY